MTSGVSTTGPRITVVVPVRDRRELLADLLSALDGQTWRDFEVIVVDDGSTDGAAEMAAAATCVGRPVRVLRTSHVGAVAARSLGVDHANGDVLAFTDSDCRPDPGWLAAGIAAIDRGADLVAGPTLPQRPPRRSERTVWIDHDDGLYPTCNVLYRRGAFDAAGGFDADASRRFGFRHGSNLRGLGFGEDTLLAWRVRRRGPHVFDPAVTVRHHVFELDEREALRRAWLAGGFCGLVREVPELRSTLDLRGGVVLGAPTRLPLYLSVVALGSRHPRLALGLAGLWALWIGRQVATDGDLTSLPAALAADAVTGVALALGSLRARTVLL